MGTEDRSPVRTCDPPNASVPTGVTLAIGSMPHRDSLVATDRILQACPEAPCWPQLPSLGFQENMMAQFSEGIPCIRVDWERSKISFARPGDCPEELTRFYEDCLEAERTGNLSAFALSSHYAKGLPSFLDRLSPSHREPTPFVKGQVTGPLTFGLSILDENGLPGLFDETLEDVVRKGILMKALWQVECLKTLEAKPILFIDEPILAAFGSSTYINLSRQQAVAVLREIFDAVKDRGAFVGSHCCGNTDWSLMVDAGVDIINFDAYVYMDSIGLYADSLEEFLDRGGLIAWGIVPSQRLKARRDPEQLFEMLVQGIDKLSGQGLSRDALVTSLLLTTSCGLGTLTEAEADAALGELRTLGALVRGRGI